MTDSINKWKNKTAEEVNIGDKEQALITNLTSNTNMYMRYMQYIFLN